MCESSVIIINVLADASMLNFCICIFHFVCCLFACLFAACSPALVCVSLFFLVGFGIIIWSSVKHHGDDDESLLQPYTLASMYNSSLAAQYPSYAWIPSTTGTDQFIVVNASTGDFYLTSLPSGAITPLIAASDINVFAWMTPPPDCTTSNSGQSSSSSRRMQTNRRRAAASHMHTQSFIGENPSADQFGATFAEETESNIATSVRQPESVPTTPRQLRPRPVQSTVGSTMMFAEHHKAAQSPVFHHHDLAPQHESTQLFASSASSSLSANSTTFRYSAYILSPDQNYMIFAVNCSQLYRHSSYCVYLLYNINLKTSMIPIGNGQPLRLASFSPNSKYISFVYNNNIYLRNIATGVENAVTTDGVWDSVLNGVHDWVYEEEIYESTAAIWWNSDSTAFAFLRFDESAVPLYQFEFFTQPYNVEFSYKYPKSGATNSKVDTYIYNVTTAITHTFPNLRVSYPYEYVINVMWHSAANRFIRIQNRPQNVSQLLSLSVQGGVDNVLPLSIVTAQYFLEPHNCLTSLYPLPYYLDLIYDGIDHLHLAIFDANTGAFVKFISGGNYDVLGLNAVNGVSGGVATTRIFYTREITQTAAGIATPTVWSVPLATVTNGTADSAQLVSYTDPNRLTMQSASFSPTASFMLLQESAVVPTTILYTVTNGVATQFSVLADNTALVASITATYAMPTVVYTQIPSSLPGLMMSVSIAMPAGVSLSDCSMHPVLLYAYSGPGSQTVSTGYSFGPRSTGAFHSLLISSYNYIVVTVDSVGTAGKGEAYRKSHTYLKLGLQERADMLQAAAWIKQQCWSDSTRVSYWGWSYGKNNKTSKGGNKETKQ